MEFSAEFLQSQATHWPVQYNRFNEGWPRIRRINGPISADRFLIRMICVSKLLILDAFSRCRRLRTVGFREIPGAIVQFELLLLQGRIYNLNLNFPV